jgi:aarF domain-containing kinase
MMTDIYNLQAFALYMQKTDIKFDLFSVTKEMEKQVHIILVLLSL